MSGSRSSEDEMLRIWEAARSEWHYPQLPRPVISSESSGVFPFDNYRISITEYDLQDSLYMESLFEHIILHYIFCPRSLEVAGELALAALRGIKRNDVKLARTIVNIFSDIVVDSFRLERSESDELKVVRLWRRIAEGVESDLDVAVISFLESYWSVDLCGATETPESRLLLQVFSPGVRDRSLWKRQCQQMAMVLSPLSPGSLGRDEIRSLEILRGNARSAPLSGLASELEPVEYMRCLEVLGIRGDLKRWYRDQGYRIEIAASRSSRSDTYPTGTSRWRFDDSPSDLDVNYSLSMSPRLVPGVTTYRRDQESCSMAPGRSEVPDLLVVLDSSRSMDGHRRGSRTFYATLAAFKAAQFAYEQGAELAAINFSESFLVQPWCRDLDAVEDVLVEYLCGRTNIPGSRMLELVKERRGCLILCITDTGIQNLYTQWDYLKEAASLGRFVLFCIDEKGKDRYVLEALGSLGRVYHINTPEDLISLVVETAEDAYG
ncbi:MAG: VWA domain-containing protein [Methanothrix sp.]|uniref:VWA domain-containing protein n=1 Tax=Methanothrix sp. TaxID=90426 RepID=UPI0025D39876|nr:VWA domain-containing protein [Methanothrix sp.]MCQ8902795.1 VWA domain-containing protein [Methanothrix sp.]